MKDWQERVVDEKRELVDKLDRLVTFMGSATYNELPNAAQRHLWRQQQLMSLYVDVLAERIEVFEEE